MAQPPAAGDLPALLAAAAGHYNQRRLKEAEQACRGILAVAPRHPQALHLIGVVAMARGDFPAAQEWLERAASAARAPGVLVDLAAALIKNWDLEGAVQCCKEALAVVPASAEAHYNLGTALHWMKHFPEAAASLREAVRLKPDFFAARLNLGRSLLHAGEYRGADEELAHALVLNPAHPGALLFHGICCQRQGRSGEAASCYEKVLSAQPVSVETLANLANAYRDFGDFCGSAAVLERMLAAAAGYPEALNDFSLALLSHGEFARGWDLYEARWDAYRWPDRAYYSMLPWNGESLGGKHLLVWAEQGLGDQIMFSNLIPDVLERARQCTLVCERKLVPLFKRSFPAAQVFARGSGPFEAQPGLSMDFQVPMGSLGRHLRRDRAAFPAHRGYLSADAGRIRAWKERLSALGPGRKVGISWRGGSLPTLSRQRTIALEAWLPVLRTLGIDFVSLQYDECAQEIEALRKKHGVVLHHWPEAIEDYDETAALVCALDGVVSVCTSLIHLTGALGRPAWVLVPAMPEWRYMREGNRMPWYPSVELLRQERVGEWDLVIARAAGMLRA